MKPKTKEEIAILREGSKLLAEALAVVAGHVKVGIKTKELDRIAEEEIRKSGGTPSFKGHKEKTDEHPYPASLCVSINEEIVHGIPGSRTLKEGDIVSLDLGMKYKGLFTDTAVTVGVGLIDENAQEMIDVCKKSLEIGIRVVRAGARVGDIGYAIQQFVEPKFYVIRELVGHGVGYDVHEDPEIRHWGDSGTGVELPEGLVIAIEPMITETETEAELLRGGWVYSTKNHSRAAHFEHTIVVTKSGSEVLTKI